MFCFLGYLAQQEAKNWQLWWPWSGLSSVVVELHYIQNGPTSEIAEQESNMTAEIDTSAIFAVRSANHIYGKVTFGLYWIYS